MLWLGVALAAPPGFPTGPTKGAPQKTTVPTRLDSPGPDLIFPAQPLVGIVRHAVIVGANDGGGVLDPLKYAENDAQKVSSLLVELGDFDESLVTVLYAPSTEDLRRALAAHAALAEQYPHDMFVFYYSGHADAGGLRIGPETYYFEALKADVRAIDSDVRVGVLDACRSGSITRFKGAGISGSMFGQESSLAEGEAWLTASSADELAQESDSLRSGFFTHYLVSGMRGAADTGDGIVDLGELYRYTFDRVVSRTGGTAGGAQHPAFEYKLTGSGGVGLTDIRNAGAVLEIPAGSAGLIAVLRLPDRVQIAEVGKIAGQNLRLAVPPGRYLVRRRDGDDLYDVTVGVNAGAVLKLEDWGSPRAELGMARGGEPDPTPLDRIEDFVQKSVQREDNWNLKDNPTIAGLSSVPLPGGGQFYNHQYLKGSLYLASTAALSAGAYFAGRDRVDPSLSLTLGLGLWGASIADAAYNVHHREERYPKKGMTLGWGGMFGAGEYPYHMGLSFDAYVGPGVTVGLDHVGYTPWRNGWDLQLGSRVMVGYDGWSRFRPGAYAAFGLRYGRSGDSSSARIVAGVGVDLRYYVVPRYFLELDGRIEHGGEEIEAVAGFGFGVHIGR